MRWYRTVPENSGIWGDVLYAAREADWQFAPSFLEMLLNEQLEKITCCRVSEKYLDLWPAFVKLLEVEKRWRASPSFFCHVGAQET